jgi:flagellar biosynthesis/type III secretory pathway M-ring protein FliF/YscJ
VASASVRAPRSYFVDMARGMSSDGKAPDEKALQALIDAESVKIAKDVRYSCGMTEDGPVSVSVYYDGALPMLSAGAVPQAATASLPLILGNHGKEIALGGLALVSLFMLMMMVRRSAPPPWRWPEPAPAGPPPHLVAGEAVAGEAGEGNPLLAGMELDEDAVVTQQMLDQVSTMVADNPDAAASLVKRWLNRD